MENDKWKNDQRKMSLRPPPFTFPQANSGAKLGTVELTVRAFPHKP